jgi:hypothetical protein
VTEVVATLSLQLGPSFVYASPSVSREEIDWAGLRAAAVAVGIRKAAREAARDLPPDEQERFVQRAMKRCSREKWLVKSQQDKAAALTACSTALSADVRKGADVLADVLATRKGQTKLHLSKYALEASQEAAEHPQKLKITRQAKEIAQTVSEVWPEERDSVEQTLVNVAILDM